MKPSGRLRTRLRASRSVTPAARWYRSVRSPASRDETAPYRIPAATTSTPAAGRIGAAAAPGVRIGHGPWARMEGACQGKCCPPGAFVIEWTRACPISRKQQGIPTIAESFAASALFVFLVLAAQYESWKLPLAIVLISADVPAGLGPQASTSEECQSTSLAQNRFRGAGGVGLPEERES